MQTASVTVPFHEVRCDLQRVAIAAGSRTATRRFMRMGEGARSARLICKRCATDTVLRPTDEDLLVRTTIPIAAAGRAAAARLRYGRLPPGAER
jgi:hypothetical protein